MLDLTIERLDTDLDAILLDDFVHVLLRVLDILDAAPFGLLDLALAALLLPLSVSNLGFLGRFTHELGNHRSGSLELCHHPLDGAEKIPWLVLSPLLLPGVMARGN